MLVPLSNYWGGGGLAPSSYAYGLRECSVLKSVYCRNNTGSFCIFFLYLITPICSSVRSLEYSSCSNKKEGKRLQKRGNHFIEEW